MEKQYILRCNLSTKKIAKEEIPEEILKLYIGGRGLGVKYIWEEVDPNINPLNGANKLIYAVGPLTGTSAPTSGRYCVVSKSPLTNTIFDSHSGGRFGSELKNLGVMAIIIEEVATTLSYIYLDAEDEIFEVRDASQVKGKTTWETTDILTQQTKRQAKVACIGPAGENKSLMACIINDKGHALGRGGIGAVMGSKNLKAVVIKGLRPQKNEVLKELSEQMHLALKKNPVTKSALPVFGTAVLVNIVNELGMFPTYNFQEGTFDDAPGISGEKLKELYVIKNHACAGCRIACGRISKVTEGEQGKGPEFETIWAFGSQIGNNDLALICEVNYLCNQLGLDTISTGNTIGCAMELAENGKLTNFPKFGDVSSLKKIITQIAYKEGIGEVLSEGSKKFAEKYGEPDLSMSVKSLELPAYDPRGAQGQGLSYATSNRGGCHLRGYLISTEVLGAPFPMDRFSISGKANIVRVFQDLSALVDSLVLCRFSTFALSAIDYAKILSVIHQTEYSERDIMNIGERIWNMERLFNLKAGFKAEDDTLPKRLLETPLEIGGSRNRVVKLHEMLPEYYKIRNWDKNGVPTKEKLAQLELS
ncbi:MAG: aldehyde ferredoxin oxidoreductase family protein [Candidatus Thorarchaeota archaeon]